MEIIAHRGLVDGPAKPVPGQLAAALALGFGVEFDVRDSAEGVVLAHDPWEPTPEPIGSFLAVVPPSGTLAINIKACGLAGRIERELAAHGVLSSRCFFFDMAIPDHLAYQKLGLPAYVRISEVEPWGPLAEQSAGVWLDAFRSTWWEPEMVAQWLRKGLEVCIVSPDLHRRDRHETWKRLREEGLHREAGLSLCTDFALEARDFFRG
jgi:hypothetical protein